MGNVISRKVFIFFKDGKDVVGKTKEAMENLKQDSSEITLDQVASGSGLSPKRIVDAAYALAPKLNLIIGKEAIVAPHALIVGTQEKKPAFRRKQKPRTEG